MIADTGNFTEPHNHYTLTDKQFDEMQGKEFEEITGLNYFGARFYEPQTGVWLNQDIYRGKLSNPSSLHRFGYVNNNPINYTDPLGLFDLPTHSRISVYAYNDTISSNISNMPNFNEEEFVENLVFGSMSPDLPMLKNGNSIIPTKEVMMADKKIREISEEMSSWKIVKLYNEATEEVSDFVVDNFKSYFPDAYETIIGVRNWWEDSDLSEPILDTIRGVDPSIDDLYQSHYGNTSWMHGMTYNECSAKEMQSKMAKDTVRLLHKYRTNMANQNYGLAAFVLGKASHYVQDTWASAHVQRNSEGQINLFQNYTSQSPTLHGNSDYQSIGDNGFDNAKYYSALLMQYANSDVVLTEQLIADVFYPLSSTASIGGTVKDYAIR